MTRVLEEDARATVAALERAEIRLAIVEIGAGESLAGLLAAAGAGQVVTGSHLFKEPQALSDRLEVSWSKIEAFGLVSDMVAAETAAAVIDTYEGGWGLALLRNPASWSGVKEEAGDAVVALGTPSSTSVRRCSAVDATRTALQMLHQESLARLSAA